MKLLNRLAKRFGYIHRDTVKRWKRGYDAAAVNRLTADWTTSQLSADSEIWKDYRRCVDRARDLERNNDYVRNFFRLLQNNVLGHRGIKLQMKVQSDLIDGPDEFANTEIENAWFDWGKKSNCTVTGDMIWEEVQELCLRATARDGNVFVRRLKNADNPFRFSIQLFESDHLDTDYNAILPNGNLVRFGVEMTPFRRRVAYHFLSNHPGDIGVIGYNSRRRVRFPAEEITHLFIRERIGQTLGVPWIISPTKRLKLLAGYEEAEVVAARVAAAKMGFIKNQTPEEWPGPSGEQKVMDVEPGTFENLDPGQEVQTFDPQHPNQSYGAFVQATLRGIAAGIGTSYHNLANDLTQVNYSSARIGMLEERECWKSIQGWLIRTLITDLFEDWLEMALLSKAANLPAEKFEHFNAPTWKARRWPWVDPEKDINASKSAIRSGFTSQRAVIAEAGEDIEEVFADQAADKKLAAAKKLTFPDLENGSISPKIAPQVNGNGESSNGNGDNRANLFQVEH